MDSIFLLITESVREAVQSKLESAIDLAPQILGAVAVFFFGLVLAELSYRGLIAMSKKLRLDYISEKVGLQHFLKNSKMNLESSHVIAKGVKGYLIFLFFVEATKVAQMDQVAEFLSQVIAYIPNVIIAIFIMLVGMRIGSTVNILISTSLSFTRSNTAKVLGIAAKYTVFTFAVLAALSQLEIAAILIQTLFIGFVAMLTLAGGLAFGLGGKDVVKELLEAIKNMELIEYMENKQEKKD